MRPEAPRPAAAKPSLVADLLAIDTRAAALELPDRYVLAVGGLDGVSGIPALVRAAAGHDLARYDLLPVALEAADEVGGSVFRWTAAGWDRLPAGHTPAGGNQLLADTDPGGDPLRAAAADGLGSELPGWRR